MEFDEKSRIVKGYGTVEIIDNQGDFVHLDAIKSIMDIYMKRGGILMDTHSNRHIGKILDWEPAEKDGHPSIFLTTQLFEDYTIDDMVWDAVKKGHYTGFSFGGRGLNKDVKCNGSGCYNDIDKVEVWEWSLVPKPANRLSTIDNFNELAKGGNIMDHVLVPEVLESGEVVYASVGIQEFLSKADKSDDCDEDEKAYLEDEEKPDEGDNERMEEESDKAANPRMGYHGGNVKERAEENANGGKRTSDTGSRPRNTAHRLSGNKAYIAEGKDPEDDDMAREFASFSNWNHPGRKEQSNVKSPYHVGRGKTNKAMESRKRHIERDSDKMDDYDKEDTPVGSPAESNDSPLNKILAKLEALEHSIIKMGGSLDTDKADLNTPPTPETGKADGATGTKVAIPEADQKNAAPTNNDDHQMQSGTPKVNLSKSDEIAMAVQDELKKMGFTPVQTPRPNVSGQQFDAPTNDLSFLAKGGADMHKILATMSWSEIDRMVGK